MMQRRHKMKLAPFERMSGNAVIAHALHRGNCPGGRMAMVSYTSDTDKHKYTAVHKCKLCGQRVESNTNMGGPR